LQARQARDARRHCERRLFISIGSMWTCVAIQVNAHVACGAMFGARQRVRCLTGPAATHLPQGGFRRLA
jgi:hypothetical protein